MSYDNNPYYNPENWDLTTIAEFDKSDGCYQFDLVVIWQTNEGYLLIGTDSGCSCPSPFEDVEHVSELTHVNPDNPAADIRNAVGEWDEWCGRSRAVWEQEVNDFIVKAIIA